MESTEIRFDPGGVVTRHEVESAILSIADVRFINTVERMEYAEHFRNLERDGN